MKEKVVVKIYDGNKKIKQYDYSDYGRACGYAKGQVNKYGFTAKIQRIVDGKPWACTTMFPRETF